MGRYSRLGKNTALVFIGTAGSKLLNLLMLPFYTRWLSAADYGSVDLISTYAGLMLVIVSCSIFESLFIFPKDKPKSEQTKYLSSGIAFWLLTSVAAALCCVAIKLFGHWFSLNGFIVQYIWLIYGVLTALYLQSMLQQFLRAIDKMVIYSSTGIVLTVTMAGLAFFLVPKQGVYGFIYVMIISNIIAIIYSMTLGKLWQYFSFRSISKKASVEMLRYSIPLIPNGIMWFLMMSLNRPVLETYVGLAGVGIFAVAGRIPNLLNTAYNIFHNAWIISVLEEAKKESFTEFYNQMLKIIVIAQSLFAVALTFFCKWLIQIFTTPDYYSSWQYIPFLTIGVISMNIGGFVGCNFAVTRESKYFFHSSVWAGIASVIANFALIPTFGLWGACWSIIISQAVCMFARIFYSWKIVKITTGIFYLKNLFFLAGSIYICFIFQDSSLKYILMTAMLAYFIAVNHSQLAVCVNLIRARLRK